MTDIVERLRSAGDREEGRPYVTMHEAADEIERLRAENDVLHKTDKWRYENVLRMKDEIGQLRAALKDVIDNIHEYERVNNLAPNPPRIECWDSVARALDVLGTKSVQNDERKG